MAGYAMNKAFLAIAILSFLPLSACGGGADNGGEGGRPPLEGASIGGPFTLTDQDGKKVSYADFDGRYRLIYFGFTYCPDVCPMDLQKLMQGYRLFEKQDPARAAKVQPIFVSIDPERDTPPVVKNYVTAFHPELVGLTGSPDEIREVAKQFAVYYAKEEPRGSAGYLVNHSRTPYLMDPEGKPLAMLPTDQPGTEADEGSPQAVLAELDRWVQ